MHYSFLEKASLFAGIISCIIAVITFWDAKHPIQSQPKIIIDQPKPEKPIYPSEQKAVSRITVKEQNITNSTVPLTTHSLDVLQENNQNMPSGLTREVQGYWIQALNGNPKAMTELA